MKLAGASALTRLAQNPLCGWQAVMLRSGMSEPKFYEALTGSRYPREYGERNSARRRGAKFERNAYANNAAQLRLALNPFIGVPADCIWVRNLEDEEPGGRESNRIRRWKRTMSILTDHVSGRRCPEILIQPQLHLAAKGVGRRRGLFIAPDILFLERKSGRYLPADLKSFVVRANQVSPADLERSRLQVAVQSMALHEALNTLGDARPTDHRGGFIFATPYGLSPHPPQVESLDGSVDCIKKALVWLERHAQTIDAAIARDGAVKEMLVLDEVPNHFQERCISSCALADVCRARHRTTALELGDVAAEVLGRDIDLDRASALKGGAAPSSEEERRVAALLQELDKAFLDLRVA